MSFPRRVLAGATVLVIVGVAVAIACNVEWTAVTNPDWIDNIDFTAGNNVSDSLIGDAIGKWDGECSEMGNTWPELRLGSGDVTVNRVDNSFLSGSFPDACGDLDPSGPSSIEGRITIWNWEGILRITQSEVVGISLDHLHVAEFDGAGNFHATRGAYWSMRGLGGELRPHVIEDVVFATR